MWFFILLTTAAAVFVIQSKLYQKVALKNLEYRITVETDEVIAGEDLYIYEELTNGKNLPLPHAKVDLILPEGLAVRLGGNLDYSGKSDTLQQYVSSHFVLRGQQTIRRRWRLSCQTRGVYELSRATILTNDLFGSHALSVALSVEEGSKNSVTVLPRILPLSHEFVSSYLRSGNHSIPMALLSDPLRIAGSRDYTPMDPMNKINWKSTAVHGHLMVNTEEYTDTPHFNILMNMQARDIEANPHIPSVPAFIERCISVCASVLDSVSMLNVPVRLIANTPPASVHGEALSDDEIGRQIFCSAEAKGKANILDMLRLLAALKMEISVPIEKLLDHVLNASHLYTADQNILVISSYLSERMIIFYEQMKRQGVHVIFFVTEKSHNALNIPKDLPIFYA